MQLPRGTFHSMKKGMKIALIVNSLKEEGFTGSCSIACGDHAIDLVVKEGNILLASCDASCGNNAMEIIGTLYEQAADASLADLTQAQMKLTLEFNEQCRVSQRRETPPKAKIPSGEEMKSVLIDNSQNATPANREREREKIIKPVSRPIEQRPLIQKIPPAPLQHTPPQPEPSRQSLTTPSPTPFTTKNSPVDIFAREGEDVTMVDRDLNALDSMDLNTMSNKIRENCKIMVEKLHLEHLMEQQKD